MSDLPLAALVLVGGYGTRLRPLTFYRSKPLVEFCNKPMVEYMLDALPDAGVTKIVFALTEYQKDLKRYVRAYQARHAAVTIVPSIETEPLGTAGPIALAREHLAGHRFFMLNSDIISRYPFRDLLAFHVAAGGEGTIMSWEVDDPSRFGVILSDADRRITEFREKPTTFIGRSINAGHYVFEPSIIDRVRPVRTSIEREIFPQMAAEGKLFVMPLQGIWADIGTPEAYISCIPLFLQNESKTIIDHSAKIGSNCVIGPNVAIGIGVTIGDSCRIQNAVIMNDSVLGARVVINTAIVGWGCHIGDDVTIGGTSVLGEDVTVNPGCKLADVKVCPHLTIMRDRTKEVIL
jgi:mannose-1-phosphate guanylyltransferase